MVTYRVEEDGAWSKPLNFLRLRGHRFISDNELVLDFEGVGTADQSFVATRTPGSIQVLNLDAEFSRQFLGVPCLSIGDGYIKLVSQLFEARADPLPAGAEWKRRFDECADELKARFNST